MASMRGYDPAPVLPVWSCSPPNIDLHALIRRDGVVAPIVEGRRAGGGWAATAVLRVGHDAGAAEGVVADFRGDAGGLGAPAHYLRGRCSRSLLSCASPRP